MSYLRFTEFSGRSKTVWNRRRLALHHYCLCLKRLPKMHTVTYLDFVASDLVGPGVNLFVPHGAWHTLFPLVWDIFHPVKVVSRECVLSVRPYVLRTTCTLRCSHIFSFMRWWSAPLWLVPFESSGCIDRGLRFKGPKQNGSEKNQRRSAQGIPTHRSKELTPVHEECPIEFMNLASTKRKDHAGIINSNPRKSYGRCSTAAYWDKPPP